MSRRLKVKGLVCRGVNLILRRADFQRLGRRRALSSPTASAEKLYQEASALLVKETGQGRAYRLLGVGALDLSSQDAGDVPADLFDVIGDRGRLVQRAEAEKAVDAIRARFGKDAIKKGRSLKARASGHNNTQSGNEEHD